MDIAVTR